MIEGDGKMSSWIDWKETNEEDKIDYYNDRKHGIIEIFARVKLPYKFYEIANAISILYKLKSFDDYVSELVYEDIERLLDGTEIVGDTIVHNITGEKTDWHEKEGESDSKDPATTAEKAADTNTFPDIELPSKEEIERKWGKIPDDS